MYRNTLSKKFGNFGPPRSDTRTYFTLAVADTCLVPKIQRSSTATAYARVRRASTYNRGLLDVRAVHSTYENNIRHLV